MMNYCMMNKLIESGGGGGAVEGRKRYDNDIRLKNIKELEGWDVKGRRFT